MPLTVGTTLGSYEILAPLGAGGMGEVYRARDPRLRREVAIKIPNLRDETGELVRRFQLEALAASKLAHANIARIYDYGESPDGRPFLVMELVEGTSLKEVLRQGRLDRTKTVKVVSGLLRGLAEAHRNGLVHRDIKPANIMLAKSGEAMILDFGLVKDLSAIRGHGAGPEDETVTAGITAPGIVTGTPAYMSPEQARGENVDARSDLFSAGLLLYQCLTGVAPFVGSSNREVLLQVIAEHPVPPTALVPHLPKGWDQVVLKALQKDPALRFQTAQEMLVAVEAAEQPQSQFLLGRAGAFVRSHRRLAFAGLAVALVLLVTIPRWLRGTPHKPSAEAAEWYRRGAVALRDGTYYGAARMLQKAVDLDPRFALAHARLAEAASELDDSARASSEMLAALPPGSSGIPSGPDGLYIDAIHRTLIGDFAEAAKEYRQLATSVPDPEKAAAWVDLGRIYDKVGQGAKALEAYREALAHDAQNAAAHLRTGVNLGRQRKPESASELDQALALYQALSNAEGQAEVLFQRGYLLSSVDPAAAKVALEKARDIARIIPSPQQDVAATLQLSTVSYLTGDIETAERTAAEGVERARREGMNYLAARGLAEMGNAQFLKRDYKRAGETFQESLELARHFRMRRAEARALFGLANTHHADGPVEAVLTEAPAALAYFREAGFQIEAAQCLMVLSRAQRDLGHGDEAIANFEQVLAAASAASDPIRVEQAQQNLASVLLTYGHLPQAVERFEEFRQSASTLKDSANVVRAISGKAGALWRLGRYGQAERILAEAEGVLTLLPPASVRPLMENLILYRKAEIFLSRGRYAEAAALGRRVLESKGASLPDAKIAGCVTGLALARLGQARAGRLMCEPAVAALSPRGDQFILTEVRMALADIALAQGDAAAAEKALSMVIDWTERVKDRETAWRAWALRAQILLRLGDKSGAKPAIQKAEQLRAALDWDKSDLQSYLGRPDIGATLALLRQATK